MTHQPTSPKHGTAKRPVLRFGFLFLLVAGILGWIVQTAAVQSHLVEPHLRQIAGLCGNLVRLFGTPCEVNGTSVLTGSFSIDVVQGCDSLYPTIILWSAIVAFPAPWSRKIAGGIVGAVALFALNIGRVVSMLYLGRAFPSLFDIIHLYAWQALFILMTLALWLAWASWSSRGTS